MEDEDECMHFEYLVVDNEENLTPNVPRAATVSENTQSAIVPNVQPGTPAFEWNHTATMFFLDLYDQRKEKFRDPKIKKKLFWREILVQMRQANMAVATEGDLDRKMRNMKKTFKNVKHNNSKSTTGRGRVTWAYYEKLAEIYRSDAIINLGSSISSMSCLDESLSETNEDITDNSEPTSNPVSGSEELEEPSSSNKKRKRPSGLYYLRQKQIKAEESKSEAMLSLTAEIAKMNKNLERKNNLLEEYIKIKQKQ